MEPVTENWDVIALIAALSHTAASLVNTFVPNPAPEDKSAKAQLYRFVNAMALGFGKAKPTK